MALHPPVLSSPVLWTRRTRRISHKDPDKQDMHICKTSPLNKGRLPNQPLEEGSLSKQPLNERSKYADQCRYHKHCYHRTHMFWHIVNVGGGGAKVKFFQLFAVKNQGRPQRTCRALNDGPSNGNGFRVKRREMVIVQVQEVVAGFRCLVCGIWHGWRMRSSLKHHEKLGHSQRRRVRR